MLKHRMSDKENPVRKKNYKMALRYKYRNSNYYITIPSILVLMMPILCGPCKWCEENLSLHKFIGNSFFPDYLL